MNEVYTGIDLGTDSVKIVVCEKSNDSYNVLACSSYPSAGIKNGFITDSKQAVKSVSGAVREINEKLGLKINKVVACVPPSGCNMDIVSGETTVVDYNGIDGMDVSNVLVNALKEVDFSHDELVTAMPIHFTIDDDVTVHDPKGMRGSKLSARVVVSTTPKEALYKILEVLKLAGLETIDVSFTSYGDYYTVNEKKFDELVGAVVNIGEESTNVSIFNRGIQIKNGVIPVGSCSVDKDLSYAFKCKLDVSRKMKEEFAFASARLADSNDIMTIQLEKKETKDVNQVNVSKVVEARVRELLKLAKNEIKNLTNREIRYIIITGGLSELSGFQNLCDEEFGFVCKVCNITTLGARHNKYSSSLGIIRYFNDKLDLRGKKYNMFTKEELEYLSSSNVDYEEISKYIFEGVFDD